MSSLSSFDDLLNELDAPPGDKPPAEDPARADCLRRLVEASKQIEKIAVALDPSEKKHPLNGQTVPPEPRATLKGVVNQLMLVQKRLQDIEEGIMAPPAETAALPPPVTNDPLRAPHDDFRPPGRDPRAHEPFPMAPTAEIHDELPPAPPPRPLPPAPAPEPKPTEADPERVEFDAYKAQWERVFADDPAQRLAHPEVAAYYEQMETYFKQKDAHAKQTASA